MQGKEQDHEPQEEITPDLVRALASEGLVDDVNWALLQIPEMTITEAVPIQAIAYRARSEQLRNQARGYDDLSKLSHSREWQGRMLDKANELWNQSASDFNEATRIEDINQEGFANMRPERPV